MRRFSAIPFFILVLFSPIETLGEGNKVASNAAGFNSDICDTGTKEQLAIFQLATIKDKDIETRCENINKTGIATTAMKMAGLDGSSCVEQYKHEKDSAIKYRQALQDACKDILPKEIAPVAADPITTATAAPNVSSYAALHDTWNTSQKAAQVNFTAAEFLKETNDISSKVSAINAAVATTSFSGLLATMRANGVAIPGEQTPAQSIDQLPKSTSSNAGIQPGSDITGLDGGKVTSFSPSVAPGATDAQIKEAQGKYFQGVSLPDILKEQKISSEVVNAASKNRDILIQQHLAAAEEFEKTAAVAKQKMDSLQSMNGSSAKEVESKTPPKNYFDLAPDMFSKIMKSVEASIEKNPATKIASMATKDLNLINNLMHDDQVTAKLDSMELSSNIPSDLKEKIKDLRAEIKKHPKDKNLREQLTRSLEKAQKIAQANAENKNLAKSDGGISKKDKLFEDLLFTAQDPHKPKKEDELVAFDQRFSSDPRLQGLSGSDYLKELEQDSPHHGAKAENAGILFSESSSLFTRVTKKLVVFSDKLRVQ